MAYGGIGSSPGLENLTEMKWLWSLLIPSILCAQQSDLYLFDLSSIEDRYELSNARFLSSFNNDGYTGQPHFVDTYRLLVIGAYDKTAGPSDIYELNIFDNTLKRLTKTQEAESAPKSTPDRQYIACIVADSTLGRKVLWRYPMDLDGGGKALLTTTKNIGQFCFLTDGWTAVYERGSPPQLSLYHPSGERPEFVSNKVGHCLQPTTDGSVVYVHKHSDNYWFLKKITPGARSEIVKKTIPGAENFTILENGSIMMGKDSKLFHLDISGDNLWKEVADLKRYGIDNITDLAFNGINMLAIVDEN